MSVKPRLNSLRSRGQGDTRRTAQLGKRVTAQKGHPTRCFRCAYNRDRHDPSRIPGCRV